MLWAFDFFEKFDSTGAFQTEGQLSSQFSQLSEEERVKRLTLSNRQETSRPVEFFGSGLVSNYPIYLHGHDGKRYAHLRPSLPASLPDRRQGEHMTIAAGFVHREGVLLCADTELTAGDRKLHASKIFHFDCALGRFAFVFAGNVNNAIATLQKMEAAVTKARQNAMGVIEHVLDREFTRLVLSQPAQFYDSHDFSLIIAFKPPKGAVEMYFTDALAIRRERFHAAVGIGAVFAEQLIDATANTGLITRGDYLALSAYILGSVKKRITKCGGASLFIDLGNNGSQTELYGDDYLKALEEWFGVYQMLTWGLFSRLADTHLSDEDFKRNAVGFIEKLIEQRHKWAELKARHVQISEAYQIIFDAPSFERATAAGLRVSGVSGSSGICPVACCTIR